MHPRADELIRLLGLAPHAEGGFYREVFRAPREVQPRDGRTARAALTAIYFLLPAGERSRWHRLRSDEVWTHLEGGPVRMHRWDGGGDVASVELGPAGPARVPAHAAPAGAWQAAEPLGEYALIGCCTAPGFEFEDWALLVDGPEAAALRAARPDLARLL